MERMTDKEASEVILARMEGETILRQKIQCDSSAPPYALHSMSPDEPFNFEHNRYLVKPEPREFSTIVCGDEICSRCDSITKCSDAEYIEVVEVI